jgi:PIN domain-containing protein
MCIIIDASVGSLFSPLSEDAKPVADWLEKGQGRIVIGGRNTEELLRLGYLRRWLAGLQRAGRVRVIDSETVLAEENTVTNLGHCVSNDAHIVALARASGARLVFTRDIDLHADLRNLALVSTPRSRIYQVARHRHLLRDVACN